MIDMEITNGQSHSLPRAVAEKPQISTDFDTFLRMLTTQMQNQDPLNPMDADAFASQLATFSMVEQQTRTNQNLEALLADQSGERILDYANAIGKTVSHNLPFQFSGAPVNLSVQGNPLNDSMAVVILNEAGDVIAKRGLSQGQDKLTWDGLDEDGMPVSVGRYSATIESTADETRVDARVLAHGEIEEARITGDRVEFVLTDGTVISQGAVLSMR